MNKIQLIVAFIMGVLVGLVFVVGGFYSRYYDVAVMILWIILIAGGFCIDRFRTKPALKR